MALKNIYSAGMPQFPLTSTERTEFGAQKSLCTRITHNEQVSSVCINIYMCINCDNFCVLTCRIYWMWIEQAMVDWTNTVTANTTGRILAQRRVFCRRCRYCCWCWFSLKILSLCLDITGFFFRHCNYSRLFVSNVNTHWYSRAHTLTHSQSLNSAVIPF